MKTNHHRKLIAIASLAVFLCCMQRVEAQRWMERLSRGVVALPDAKGETFVSWRLMADDPANIVFYVEGSDDGTQWKRLTPAPISKATSCTVGSDSKVWGYYSVIPSVDGKEWERSQPCKRWSETFLQIPIKPIENYRLGDASAADLDGDGEWELVVHQHSNGKDNGSAGMTGRPILDAYRWDGTLLWRIDLGINIREGQHYTQFMVYDLDGDGKAEVACKTADGTRDGKGKVLGDASRDYRNREEGKNTFGRILEGPEYLTVFDGATGAELHTVPYVPGRDPIDGWGGIGGNGGNDRYGNRCDRFLACVAYLDGEYPSLVMCRGVYGRTVLAAWDFRDGKLSQRWVFDSGISYPPYRDASKFSGMGGHSLSVADVDRDGKDEIIYHAMVIDDDGKGLYSTGFRHGDAMHCSDLDPDHPGQEVFTIHENEDDTVRFGSPGAALRDAATGEVLWSHSPGIDVPAGLAADIDPRHPGCEMWGGPGGLRNAKGESIGKAPRTSDFAIWWDGDLLRELVGRDSILKWNWEEEREVVLLQGLGRSGGRGPMLMGDLLGDWREEVLMVAPDGRSMWLHVSTHPTQYRLPCLLEDPQYRLGITWQNVVYNKPPHPSFFLGENMKSPERPNVKRIERHAIPK